MPPDRVYLDHHATTPCDPAVVAAMLPYFTERCGNPSSLSHAFGQEARAAVEEARALVAGLVGATPEEIVFTSGATESDNLAVRGLARASRERGRHVVTTTIEHSAVLEPCRLGELASGVLEPAQGTVDACEKCGAEAVQPQPAPVAIEERHAQLGLEARDRSAQ